MQTSDKPEKLMLPFAGAGGKNAIPVASQIGIVAGAASLTDGFPPLTRTPLEAGGVPPSGLDMNGILFEMSAISRWMNAGAGYSFDNTFATDSNVNGYPKGSQLLRSDGKGYWLNLAENNITNPESSPTGWGFGQNSGISLITMTSSNYTLTPLEYGLSIILITGLLTTNLNLILPTISGHWTVINNTTGNYNITAKTSSGIGVVLLKNRATGIICDGTNIISNGNIAANDVRAFGAKGDGITDDYLAIVAALASNYGSIYFPTGKYRTTLYITIPNNKLIYGDGKYNSIIASDFISSGINLLYLDRTNNATFANISLWGNLTENAGTYKAFGVYNYGSANITFFNCQFSTFTTFSLTLRGTSGDFGSWIVAGNKNSIASVTNLLNNSCKNIKVLSCDFNYAGSNHAGCFGGNGVWFDDCTFDENVSFFDFFTDDATDHTPLLSYSVNTGVFITNCRGTHGIQLDGCAVGQISNCENSLISSRSYDFEQQNDNFGGTEASPFLWFNYIPGGRSIKLHDNKCNQMITESGGFIEAYDNHILANADATTLIECNGNAILWTTGSVTYYDSLLGTSYDTVPLNTTIRNNRLDTNGHATIVGIGFNALKPDLHRIDIDNVFINSKNGSFFAFSQSPSSNILASSLMYSSSANPLKLYRVERMVNGIFLSGTSTVVITNGTLNGSVAITWDALPVAPLVFAVIQNGGALINAERPVDVLPVNVTTTGCTLDVVTKINVAATRTLQVGWFVMPQ